MFRIADKRISIKDRRIQKTIIGIPITLLLALSFLIAFLPSLSSQTATAAVPSMCIVNGSAAGQTSSISMTSGHISDATFTISLTGCNVIGYTVIIGIFYAIPTPSASALSLQLTDNHGNSYSSDATFSSYRCAGGSFGYCIVAPSSQEYTNIMQIFSTTLSTTSTSLTVTLAASYLYTTNGIVNWQIWNGISKNAATSCTGVEGWDTQSVSPNVLFGENRNVCNITAPSNGLVFTFVLVAPNGATTYQGLGGTNWLAANSQGAQINPNNCSPSFLNLNVCSIQAGSFLNAAQPLLVQVGYTCISSCGGSTISILSVGYGTGSINTNTNSGLTNTQCNPRCITSTSGIGGVSTSASTTIVNTKTSTYVNSGTTTKVTITQTTIISGSTTTISATGTTTYISGTSTSSTTNTQFHTTSTNTNTNGIIESQYAEHNLLYFYGGQNGLTVSETLNQYNATISAVDTVELHPTVYGAVYITTNPTQAPSISNPYKLKWVGVFTLINGTDYTNPQFIYANPSIGICAGCYYATAFMANDTGSNSYTVYGSGISLQVWSTTGTSIVMNSYPATTGEPIVPSFYSETISFPPLTFFTSAYNSVATSVSTVGVQTVTSTTTITTGANTVTSVVTSLIYSMQGTNGAVANIQDMTAFLPVWVLPLIMGALFGVIGLLFGGVVGLGMGVMLGIIPLWFAFLLGLGIVFILFKRVI